MINRLSIIIVTYNASEYLKACLLSVLPQLSPEDEVIIVDNNSFDNVESGMVYDERVLLVKNESNVGFAAASNIGAKSAKNQWLVFLNPDTVVTNDLIDTLHSYNLERETLYSFPMLVFNQEVVDVNGMGCTFSGKGIKLGEGMQFSEIRKRERLFGVSGGSMVANRDMFFNTGGFDEEYFLIHEDVDFCFRFMLCGGKAQLINNVWIYHKVHTSIGVLSNVSVYYNMRNTRYVWLKNMPLKLMIKYFHEVVIQEIATFFYFAVKHRKFRLWIKAWVDFIKAVPVLLEKRKQVMLKKRVSDEYIESMLTSIFDKEMLKVKMRKILNKGK